MIVIHGSILVESMDDSTNWVIRPQGDLSTGQASYLLEGLMTWFHSGALTGCLDLGKVETIDYSCLSVLVSFQKLLKSAADERHIVIGNVHDCVRPLFQLSQLRKLFPAQGKVSHV